MENKYIVYKNDYNKLCNYGLNSSNNNDYQQYGGILHRKSKDVLDDVFDDVLADLEEWDNSTNLLAPLEEKSQQQVPNTHYSRVQVPNTNYIFIINFFILLLFAIIFYKLGLFS